MFRVADLLERFHPKEKTFFFSHQKYFRSKTLSFSEQRASQIHLIKFQKTVSSDAILTVYSIVQHCPLPAFGYSWFQTSFSCLTARGHQKPQEIREDGGE